MNQAPLIRTRIAPSPTGPLHVGTARSALFSYAFARQAGGTFILRIEDTDIERSEARYEEETKEALRWLGIEWDEFYKQTERLDVYEKYLRELFSRGAVYWCPHTVSDLEAERARQLAAHELLLHRCDARDAAREPSGDGVLRFRNDDKRENVFDDAIRGEIRTQPSLIGDFSVAKSFREPLYNFAAVVDDAEMKISHVIRGEDHISNTPKQLLLQNALCFSHPIYAHLPLVLGSDRSKLSKRHGPTSVLNYRVDGFLPEAMINFLALLGWHPAGDNEIFSMNDFIRDFSLARTQKAGAVFDLKKLEWLNREYIRRMPPIRLAEQLKNYVDSFGLDDDAKWQKVVELSRDRLTRLSDIAESAKLFYAPQKPSPDDLRYKGTQPPESVAQNLAQAKKLFGELDESRWTRQELENAVMPYADQQGRGEVLWPLRVALSGEKRSPGQFEIAEILGKTETLRRLDVALARLTS